MNKNGTRGECAFYHASYLTLKFYFVVLAGSMLSTCCFLGNCVSVYLLGCQTRFRHHYTYLAWLAATDAILALCYIPLMSMQVFAEWLPSLMLYNLWHVLLRPLFALSHVVLAANSFLMICASLQRYFITTGRVNLYRLMQQNRIAICILSVSLGVVFRGTRYLEVTTVTVPNCTGFSAVRASLSELALNPYYRTVWMFYIRNAVTVFAPFLVLLYCNTVIVMTLKTRHLPDGPNKTTTIHRGIMASSIIATNAKIIGLNVCRDFIGGVVETFEQRRNTRQGLSTIRSATRMMVLVVLTYLLSNILNIVITVWETVDQAGLQNNYPGFYTLCSDTISFLRVLAGAVRLPIYALCNQTLRDELLRLCGWRRHQTNDNSNQRLNGQFIRFVALIVATSTVDSVTLLPSRSVRVEQPSDNISLITSSVRQPSLTLVRHRASSVTIRRLKRRTTFCSGCLLPRHLACLMGSLMNALSRSSPMLGESSTTGGKESATEETRLLSDQPHGMALCCYGATCSVVTNPTAALQWNEAVV